MADQNQKKQTNKEKKPNTQTTKKNPQNQVKWKWAGSYLSGGIGCSCACCQAGA